MCALGAATFLSFVSGGKCGSDTPLPCRIQNVIYLTDCLATLRASNPLPQRDHSIPSHVLRGLEAVWLVEKKAHQNLFMFKLGLYQNGDNKIVFDCS